MKKRTYLLAATIASSMFLSACSENESAENYITQAQESLVTNQVNESIIALKNAIKVEPNNGQARYMLGSLYLDLGSALNAVKELEKAKRFKYDINLVTPKLARAYHLGEEVNTLIELDDKADNLSDDARLALYMYQAIAYLKLDKLDDAKLKFISTKQLDENSGYSLLTGAHIDLFKQDVKLAKQQAEESLRALPNQPEAIMLLANIASIEKQHSIASEYYLRYLKLQPEQKSAEIMLANAYLQNNDFELAAKHAQNIIKVMPNQPFANHIMAMVKINDKDYENASKYAETAISNKFNQLNTKLVAGVSAFYLKNFEQANYHLKPLIKFLPDNHFARRMLVVSQLELGIIDNVSETIGDVTIDESSSEFYSALSYKLLQAGAKKEAKELIGSMENSGTETPENLLRDGVLKVLTNDQGALASLEKAVELDPTLVKAELMLAYLAINSGELNKAQNIALKWQKEYPTKADGYNLESAIAMKKNNPELALTLLNKSLSIEPNNVYALLQISQLYATKKDQEKAIEYVDRAYEAAPNNTNVLRQFFQFHPTPETLIILAEKADEHQDNINYRLIYVEALMKTDKVEKGISELNEIAVDHKTPKLYWLLKVAGYRELSNINSLKSTLIEWRKINSYQIEPIVYLADVYVIERNLDEALKTIDSGLLTHEDDLTLKLAKLQILIRAGKAQQARELYYSLASNITNKHMVKGIEGKLALLENDYASAVALLEPYFAEAPSQQNAMYLVTAYVNNNERPKAINLLQKIANQTGFNNQVYTVLGSLYLETNNKDQALKVYQEIAKNQPDNVVALNNAAWLLMEKEDFINAENHIVKAVEIAPNQPDILDTFAQILAKNGKPQEAISKSRKAFELSKGSNPDIALNYIELLVSEQRFNEAKIIIKGLKVSNKLQENRKNQIEKLIESN